LFSPETFQPDRAHLLAYYREVLDPITRARRSELQQLRDAENQLVNDVPEIMVMREMPTRRPTHVLRRGAYDAPGELVAPGMPSAILPFDPDLPPNRLGLARWMTDPRNPLTARVAVNRVWRTCFGRGLVATVEDFGSQGDLPTHPELLDWLAYRFMESGWDLKSLFKLVVTSASYRQTSIASPALLERDPDNRLLARGPRQRLEAESIRDSALAISRLLSPRIGGPSVRPYQPKGVWEEAGTGKTYVPDTGENLHRRSLYTFWRRTAPPPNMLAFDATSREVCTAKRESTTTPLQALVLLNDTQFVEAARALAEQLVRQFPANLDARISQAFRLATGRHPQPAEVQVLRRLYGEQLRFYETAPETAQHLVRTGESPIDSNLNAPDVAATTILASTLMNLDEFITAR